MKAVAERKGSTYDLLDGATLGELVNLASSERYFFREQFLDEKIVVRSIQLLSGFKKYHHETPKEDVPKREFDLMERTFSTLKNFRRVKQ